MFTVMLFVGFSGLAAIVLSALLNRPELAYVGLVCALLYLLLFVLTQ